MIIHYEGDGESVTIDTGSEEHLDAYETAHVCVRLMLGAGFTLKSVVGAMMCVASEYDVVPE